MKIGGEASVTYRKKILGNSPEAGTKCKAKRHSSKWPSFITKKRSSKLKKRTIIYHFIVWILSIFKCTCSLNCLIWSVCHVMACPVVTTHLFWCWFQVDNHDTVEMGSMAEVKWISHLLELDDTWLKQALTQKVTVSWCFSLFLLENMHFTLPAIFSRHDFSWLIFPVRSAVLPSFMKCMKVKKCWKN